MRRPAARFPFATFAVALVVATVFALELVGDGQAICAALGFVPAHASLESALTSLFLHDPSGWTHVLGNLAVLVLVGVPVERTIGSFRFAALFVAGGLAGAALHVVVDPNSIAPLVGCSGSLFAILAVASVLFGAPMLAFVAVLALTNVAHAFGAPGAESVSFGAHCGGLFAGFVFVALSRALGSDVRHAVA